MHSLLHLPELCYLILFLNKFGSVWLHSVFQFLHLDSLILLLGRLVHYLMLAENPFESHSFCSIDSVVSVDVEMTPTVWSFIFESL